MNRYRRASCAGGLQGSSVSAAVVRLPVGRFPRIVFFVSTLLLSRMPLDVTFIVVAGLVLLPPGVRRRDCVVRGRRFRRPGNGNSSTIVRFGKQVQMPPLGAQGLADKSTDDQDGCSGRDQRDSRLGKKQHHPLRVRIM